MRRIAIRRRFKNMVYYLMAGLIPFILAVVAYARITDIMYEEALQTDISQLQHKQEMMDGFLLNVQSIGYTISNDATIQSIYALDQVSGADISTLRDAITNMSIGNAIFDPVQRQVLCGYYVFYQDSKVVLNIRDRAAFLTGTWQNAYNVDGMTASQWYDLVFGDQGKAGFIPRITLNINGTLREVALYLQPIPVGLGNSRAMVVIALDMARFAELMLPQATLEGESVCLMDGAGGCLYPSGGVSDELRLLSLQIGNGQSRQIQWGGQDTVVMMAQSAYTNWSLLWALPTHAVASASERLQLFVSLSTVAIILFAVLMTVMAAYLNSKPIREISRMLFSMEKPAEADAGTETVPARDMDVSYGVQQLISLNKSIQVDLNEYRERLGEVMLDRLLEGKLLLEEEMGECARFISGLPGRKAFAVLLIRLHADKAHATGEDIEKLYMQRMVVLHHLTPKKNEIIHPVNTDEIAVLFLLDSDPQDDRLPAGALRERAGEILEQLGQMGHFNIKMGIGELCRRPVDLCRSAEQARTALFMAGPGEQIILYDRQSHESADAYYYPLEEERRLINTVRSGNGAEARCILDGIYAENYIKRKLNPAVLEQLQQEMQGTLTKLLSSVPSAVSAQSGKAAPAMADSYPDAAFNELCGEIIGLCACFAEGKHTGTEDMVQRIVDYLETVYMDENVSLNQIASKFKLSEAYLSRIFKEQTGENFTARLERIRLHHAQRLLTQTRIPIHEIVHRVGYAYDDTFRKAFKRFHGISPGEYRNLAATQPGKAG